MQEAIGTAEWLELRLAAEMIDEAGFDTLCESLDAVGTAFETDADSGMSLRIAWFACGEAPQRMRAAVTAAALLAGVAPDAIHLQVLGDDWATAWQRDWRAMPVGRRLWVRPSFCEPPSDDRLDIVLDPGMAFGTGQHATTRLCLEAIERICDEAMPATMLDMGAGSGLLAIAAAALGVRDVLAVDNDAVAVEACRTNAAANGVAIRCEWGDTPPDASFDLVVANILAGPLIDMVPGLAACTGRRLVLSGLLQTQAEAVSRAYEAQGLKALRTEAMAEWAAIELIRP